MAKSSPRILPRGCLPRPANQMAPERQQAFGSHDLQRKVGRRLPALARKWALAERVRMRQGQPDGTAESFHPSGFLKARAILRDGRLLSQEHWPDGERKADSLRREPELWRAQHHVAEGARTMCRCVFLQPKAGVQTEIPSAAEPTSASLTSSLLCRGCQTRRPLRSQAPPIWNGDTCCPCLPCRHRQASEARRRTAGLKPALLTR